MPLEKIISKIDTESRAECDAIIGAAQAQAQNILAQSNKELKDKENAALEAGRKEAANLKIRLLQSAELSARKEMLSARQELLEEVFAKSLEQIKNLPDDKYRNIIKNMLLSSPLTGDEQVIVSTEDAKRLGGDFISQVNGELKERGKNSRLELISAESLSSGGFILKQDLIENNNSFAGLLRAKRDELELKVAKILFSE